MTRALLVALLIAVVIGVIGTFYFWQIRRRRDEAESGVRALSAMRWREFAHFVLDAMRHRGYDVITPADEAERSQQTEFLLVRDGERALLGCKHGSAYRLSKQTVSEFIASMRFQGARSGLLVTSGTIDDDARRSAEQAHIELVDGLKLWPEISPLLPPSLNEDVRKAAAHRARRQVVLSWIGAAVAGLALGLLLSGMREAAPPQDMSVLYRKPVPAAPAAAPVATPSTTTPIGISAPSTAVVAATPEQEDEQRAEVVRLIVTIPGVERAVWSTKSTLLVHVDETTTQRFDEICGVLMHYANLRTARVHLQPPPDSQYQVRFKQCATQ